MSAGDGAKVSGMVPGCMAQLWVLVLMYFAMVLVVGELGLSRAAVWNLR